MDTNISQNRSLLGDIIIGRIEPQIYAFTTETIPNYLKVGDTYRPVKDRIKEWRDNYYPDLIQRYTHSAMLESGNIFRDHAVHYYLETYKGFHRLQREDLCPGIYYSREFFKDADIQDVDDAISDIQQSERNADGRYKLYDSSRLPVRISYVRGSQDFPLRKNQEEAVKRFEEAVNNGRTNLLMYAVMRFGKSFTAMCCANRIDARFVLIVSAKADVKGEWKKTVESHVFFNDYDFLHGEDLNRDALIARKTITDGRKVALFLTLQDLQGDVIKDKHKDVFAEKIDLLIVDETHFGARAAEYGKVLDRFRLSTAEKKKEMSGGEFSDEIENAVKSLHAKVQLHLSGTPYRILMGDEFTKDDIIAFCQYTDIIDAKEKWDLDHSGVDGDDLPEWKNPYYGFPQMIRFAFQPNEASIKKMRQMKEDGVTFAFSELFRPESVTKTRDGRHKRFVHRAEVLELFKAIDGCKPDENLLSFLDCDEIKKGKMCRHIVCVLPFRASCDALEEMLTSTQEFHNLNKYTIVNIAGVDNEHLYNSTESVKAKIKECEKNDCPTITLTVNRMLTGSTVKEWDTMLFFKDTASPQEYDQAIFRIQNQYIKVFVDEDGNEIRYNMKPQTLLVDFDPDRLFRMQELKSQFYNVNKEKAGNDKLRQRIERELIISPIITLNKGLLKKAEATDVMAVVQQYSQNKSIIDEATDIPFDLSLLDYDVFKAEIEKLNCIDAQKGVEFKPNEGDDDSNFTIPPLPPSPAPPSGGKTPGSNHSNNETGDDKEEDITKKLAAYYSKILFYAFLTSFEIKSLEGVIYSLTSGDSDNRRIANNLGLKVPILSYLQQNCNPFILSKLDYKIQSVNELMRDKTLTPLQRAENAMKRFARVSESEVATPPFLANELVDLLPCSSIRENSKILDIASVQGEMVKTLYARFGKSICDNVYSIPTSPLSYELTRKVYTLLELPLEHIFPFYADSLIGDGSGDFIKVLADNHFDVVIGVPPFGQKIRGGRDDGKRSIYQLYFFLAKDSIRPKYISMMTQSTWYSGGRGDRLDDFRNYMLTSNHIREFHDYPNVQDYVNGVTTLRGGVCLFLWDSEYIGNCRFVNRINNHDYDMERPLQFSHNDYTADFLIRWNKGLSILKKVLDKDTVFLPDNGMMYTRNPFGLPNTSDNFPSRKGAKRSIKVYLNKGNIGYATREQLSKNPDDLLNKWKVLVAKSSSGGDELPHLVISSPIVSEPGSVTANTHYTITGVKNQKEAENLADYLRTKFARFMINLLRSNQNMRVDMYTFVPRLDFSQKWTNGQLYKRYGLDKNDQEFIDMIVKDRPENIS